MVFFGPSIINTKSLFGKPKDPGNLTGSGSGAGGGGGGGWGDLPITNKLIGPVQPTQVQTTQQTQNTGYSNQQKVAPTVQTENEKMGSIVDFQRVMRAISQDAYESRAKAEKKVTGSQFDPGKVSGSIFKDIIDFVEKGRGGDISKMYGAGMSAAEKSMALEEEKRQFDIKTAEAKQQFETEQYNKYGVDSYSSETGFSGATQASGMPWRTDRNNNPIAFAVKLGNKNEYTNALDKAGIQWTYGDAFPGDPSMVTVRIIGDPIEASRAVLRDSAAIQNWYYNAASGGVLRQMGITNNQQFAALPIEEQNKIIIGVYKGEAGSGALVKSILQPQNSDANEALARQYKAGTLTAAQIPAAVRGKVLDIAEDLGQQTTPEQKAIAMKSVNVVNSILENDKYKGISGGIGGWGTLPFTEAWQTATELKSFSSNLQLAARQALKGQGSISDFEMKVLSEAATDGLDRNVSEEEFKKKLITLKASLMLSVGEVVDTAVSKNGQTITAKLNRQQITDLIADGALINYQ